MAAPKSKKTVVTEMLIKNYGVTVDLSQLRDILHYSCNKSVRDWLNRNEVQDIGKKNLYWSEDIAKAMIETGGAV